LVLVVEIKLSVNLNALTIEQVVGKRKKLLVDMTGNMAFEVRSAAPSGAADVFARLLKHTVSRGALDERSRATEWYNEDPNFKEAVRPTACPPCAPMRPHAHPCPTLAPPLNETCEQALSQPSASPSAAKCSLH
jgi:hypothetical protein